MTEFSSEIFFKDESFIKEESNLHFSNDVETKCGEIILLANTNFWIVCTFCDERFHNIVIFQNHIKGIHIADADSVTYTEEENPLDVPTNEDQLVIKFDSDASNGEFDDQTDDCETSNYKASKPNRKEINDENKSDFERPIIDCNIEVDDPVIDKKSESDTDGDDDDENGEVFLKQTGETSMKNLSEHERGESLSENEDIKCQQSNKALYCKDIEDLLPAPKKVKKRNRKKKDHSCGFCQHSARDKISLEAHLRSVHGTGTRHQCEECGKCFRNATNLKSHLIIHSGTRPFKCEICNTGFSHPNSLKTHRYIHTGERPHKCNQCDKGFVSTSALKTHLREHTGEIPYVCQFCERGFASKCSFNRHMLSHSGRRPHECELCDKAFIHKETLKKHMACHSSEKKFVCDICPKKFNHKKNLTQHQKLHLDIKQYICKLCDKDFAQYAGLYSHMKYHKNKE